ncbi:MAG TPA: AMP-binding protein [Trebonia sp.]|nr:AMP-binding protein [Trebonia sp.]
MIRDWIKQAAAAHGADLYLADARGSAGLTYAGLLDTVNDVERRLDAAGLPPGARIVVKLGEPLEYATALVAIVAAGRVAVPLDPAAPDTDVARVVGVARPTGVIYRADAARGGAQGDPRGEVTRPFDRAEFDFDVIDSVDPLGTAPAAPALAGGGIFLCTSGTTGTPKGILLREEQLAHVAASVVECHKLGRGDRGYCSLPLFHVNAEVVGVLATLKAGAYLAVDRKFSRRGFWQMISDREITWINAVPAIISILSIEPPADRPAALRFVRSASAPLSLAALERFENAFGVPVVETYGMTEAASMITANPVDGPRKPGSAGRPAGSQVQIALPGGGTAAPGEVGRVQIRGAGVITGYDSGGRPGVIDADGWLDTSDLGYLDADGYLFLVGRADDVINRGGEKIYPREIEEILLAQPGVRSAAVVGATDEVLGERPVAYVVTDVAAVGDEVEAVLREVCAAQLPRHKQPSEFCLVAEMPLGPTGKISRRQLKDLVTTRP